MSILKNIGGKMTNTKTLMFENTANVGDKIRAYEFAPSETRGDYYLEGIVTDKGMLDSKDYYSYKIKITKVVFGDKDVTEKRNFRFSYVPFETDMDDLEKKFYPKGKARVMKISEPSIKVEYFVWGLVDGEHKSFYVPVGGLEKFMDDQKLSVFTKNQIRNLQHCQGLELEKGFTIERRYTFGNGETSKKFKINLEA
jgi:hypothetical protein